MNSWPFHELKRQVEYKAAWEGVPVVTLSVKETRGTTMDCPRCGERLQAVVRGDAVHHRQLRCKRCERWEDRDLVAVMNISHRGWVRFAQSRGKGAAGEAMTGNLEGRRQQVILRVDASKLCQAQQTQ
jgi:transposase